MTDARFKKIPQKVINFLEEQAAFYERPAFIGDDPISIPHQFSKLQDVEIAGFFAALFAWGNRKTILNKANELMALMHHTPYDFIRNHQPSDLKPFEAFKHRTFNATDILFFIHFLQQHYQQNSSLESAFLPNHQDKKAENIYASLTSFYNYIFSLEYTPQRSKKHISNPAKNATCKRLNMYLRWMVRPTDKGVDFGLWKNFQASQLILPVDVHVLQTAQNLGLADQQAKPNWQLAVSLTEQLKSIDKIDPVKFDFALFGAGVYRKAVAKQNFMQKLA